VAWLVRGDDVLCSVQVAEAPGERMTGLLGRDGVEGALLLPRCRNVHTVGMRFAIDVAYLTRHGTVVATVTPMRRWRLGRISLRGSQVLEAEAGAFDRWKLTVGDRLEVR